MIMQLNTKFWQTDVSIYIQVFNSRRSEEHTSELQSRGHLVCRLLLEISPLCLSLHSFPTRRSSDLDIKHSIFFIKISSLSPSNRHFDYCLGIFHINAISRH